MLEISNLTITIELKEIIKNLNLIVNEKDKIAIIGEEGNGKSTLLKLIADSCNYATFTGSINLKNNKIGYLRQFIEDTNLDKKVFDYLFMNNEEYYNHINDLYKYLKVLNIEDTLLERTITTLSGGEKVKIQLLKILLDEPDILLLDEPSNDLDITTLEWLEEFINSSNYPILFVSHDETLLSRTANGILHLELTKKKTTPKWTFEHIGYDEYVNKRIRNIVKSTQIAKKEKVEYDKKVSTLTQIMNKVEYQQDTISRANPHGGQLLKKHMKTLKYQERKLDDIELKEIPDVEEEINFHFEDVKIPSKSKIFEFDDEIKVNNKTLVKNAKLSLYGNSHIVIIGNNGIGKTTLLKQILPLIGSNLKVGYMPQDYDAVLNSYKTPIDFITNEQDKSTISKVRSYLGNMKFTREEMTNDIKYLSGGSKAKLFLLKLVLTNVNVLVLDEPTRNVSPLSNPIIRRVLASFKGSIISVSHDRKYITEVCDKVYELTKFGISDISNKFNK